MNDLQSRLQFAVQIAREAGAITLRYFRSEALMVEHKTDASPVTLADRQAEEHLRARIQQRYPEDGILGEEFGEKQGTSGNRWILDPLDGTKSFVRGVPLYGTMVAMEAPVRESASERVREGATAGLPSSAQAQRATAGLPSSAPPRAPAPKAHGLQPVRLTGRSEADQRDALLGVVFLPALDELVYAARGLGAWQQRGPVAPASRRWPGDHSRARVSQVARLADAAFSTTSVQYFAQAGIVEVHDRLWRACRLARGWGDCYGHILVATGRIEVMLDPVMNVWDCAALKPILEEAGGTFTDLRGVPTIHGGNALSTNGRVLDEVLAMINA